MTTDQAKEATTLETTLETKLKQLLITCGRTNAVLDSSKDIAIERQMEALKALSTEVETSRRAVEAVKIINDEEEAEIDNWNAEIEAKLAKGDNEFKRLDIWLDHRKQAKEKLGREEKMKFELELHETKMKLETEHQAKTTANQPTVEEKARAKLPKLTISKFNGTYMDWSRFWSQFEESVEKSGLATVTKFSYLKELLDSKVRREVEALPFTPEGYNRAKAILTEKYGKESETVKAYGKEILDLPYISSTNPRKIKEFSEKLTYCVQSLETLKKLDEVKGLVAITLDKLPAIGGDLVRSDNQWESWDFCQLAEALRLWLRRHPVDSQQEHENEQNTKRRERRANMFNTAGRTTIPRDVFIVIVTTTRPSSARKLPLYPTASKSCQRKDYALTVLWEAIEQLSAKVKYHVRIVEKDTTHHYVIKLVTKKRRMLRWQPVEGVKEYSQWCW